MSRLTRFLLCAALLAAAPIIRAAQVDLFQLSLDELMKMEITSVSKKRQPMSEAAAAIQVITREDIRRSGMTSIPELLRMVSGLHVANIDANKWAIGSRGFNGRWSNKLLVLMDGRSLYTPMFSGVYWDIQDTLLEDIERIEVILGPGGTLWGANAVNGVINIITRNSRDTQGGLAAARAGNREHGVDLRYGSTLGDTGWFRVYAKAKDHDGLVNSNGDAAYDAWDQQRAGFRADWDTNERDTLTLQGDIYRGESDQETGYLSDVLSTVRFMEDTVDQKGANLLFRWNRTGNDGSGFEFQTYFDHTERNDIALDQHIDTLDLDFQYRFQATERQEITWGLNYRHYRDEIDGTFTVSFGPASKHAQNYGAFVQDAIRLRDDLHLTVGSKFEQNKYSGFEFQPSARLLWKASEKDTFWGAASRAVRTPGRTDQDIRINIVAFSSPFVDPDGPGPLPAGAPALLSILGSQDVKSEKVHAFEVGYRGEIGPNLSVDVTGFFNSYDDLLTGESSFSLEATPLPAHALISRTFDNQMEGTAHGLELTANWQVTPAWRMHAGYTWQKFNMTLDPTSTDRNNVGDREDANPEQQFQLRSQWSIAENINLDATLFHVGSLTARDASGPVYVPAYERLDIRFGWQPNRKFELSLVGQNLLDDAHTEYVSSDILPTAVRRAVYGKVTYRFN